MWRLLCYAIRVRGVLFYLMRNSKQGFEDLKRLATLTKSFAQYPFLERLLTSINYDSLSEPVIQLVDTLMKHPFLSQTSVRMYIWSLRNQKDKLLKTSNERKYFLCCFEWKSRSGERPIDYILGFLDLIEQHAKFKQRCQTPYYLLHYWHQYMEIGNDLFDNSNEDDSDDESNDNNEE